MGLLWVIAAVCLLIVAAVLRGHGASRCCRRARSREVAPPVAVTPPKPGEPRFCLSCGAAVKFGVVEGGKERHHCSCGWIHWNNPVPVAVVVIPSRDGVVLIKRKLAPAAGKWALPAGFVDAFEAPEEAARREAFEETGLKVKIRGLIKTVMTPGKNVILLFYLAERCDDAPVPGDDALEAAVFKLDSLPEMPFSTHVDTLRECVASGKFAG